MDNAKIAIQKDGNQWCVLWGEDLQVGFSGFGDTLEEAMIDFALDISSNREVLAEGIIRKENNQGGLMGYKLWIDNLEWCETIKFNASRFADKKVRIILEEVK